MKRRKGALPAALPHLGVQAGQAGVGVSPEGRAAVRQGAKPRQGGVVWVTW